MKKVLKFLSPLLAAVVALSFAASFTPAVFAEGEVINVTDGDELYDALNKSTPVAAINITADITVDKDCLIYYDAEHIENYCNTVVTVNEGVTVTIAAGGSLGSFWPSYEGDWETPPLTGGRLINNGTLIIEKRGMIEADFDTNNGDVLIKNGGMSVCCGLNTGNVTVEDGGMYLTSQGKNAVNKGIVIIHDGALMVSRFGSAIVNDAEGEIVLNGDFMCGCMGFDDGVMLFENNGTVTGRGSVKLDNMSPEGIPAPDLDVMIERMMSELGQTSRFDDWEDIGIYAQYEVTSYDDIVSHFKDRTVAGEHVEGNMDLIFFVIGDIVIPEGDSIEAMSMFEIAQDASLTVSGGALLECGIINRSRLEVMPGGTLATTMGGNITNEGELIIHEGAELKSQMGGAVINDGGAELTLDGTFYCGCVGDGFWFDNHGTVKGKGNVILYEAAPDILPANDIDALAERLSDLISDTENEIEVNPGLDWTPGDINGDGAVNNKDIIALFRYTSGSTGGVDERALDPNGDGAVNNKDIVYLFRYVSGADIKLSEKPYIA